MSAITKKDLQSLRKNYEQNDKARVVKNALTKNDIQTISRVFDAEASNPNLFSIDLKTMPVTNQMASGRCWIFSAMNVFREIIAKKYEIKEFELSQNYIAFYDKLEKANWFMECVVKELDQPLSSAENRFLLEGAVGDGGQWNMLLSLVKKYGLCPKTAMPETYQSSHTRGMNAILNKRLRRFAIDIRKVERKEIAALREVCLKEIYSLLVSCFGMPPEEFTFEYEDKKGKYHAVHHVKPLEFYEKYLAIELDDYVNVIHGPTKDKKYYQIYSV
ncbi:MAG: peptidase C1, partial [Solobacterium sp.]|nr:peptidase C1 [Solobacterium sp.]